MAQPLAGRAQAARASPHRAALYPLPPGHHSRSSASRDTGPAERQPSSGAIAPGAVLSAAQGVCTAVPCLGLLLGSGPAQGGRERKGGGEGRGGQGRGQDRTGQEGSCQEGSFPGFALDWQVFLKVQICLCCSHSPGQEELRDRSRSHQPCQQVSGDRALPLVTLPMLSPAACEAFLRPRLSPGGQEERCPVLAWPRASSCGQREGRIPHHSPHGG